MREHSPLCDTSLGPEFVVEDGSVTMTIHVCVDFACLKGEQLPPS